VVEDITEEAEEHPQPTNEIIEAIKKLKIIKHLALMVYKLNY
jgi:hypothetical protein